MTLKHSIAYVMSTTCVLGRGGWTIGERFDDRF
ncbi:thymidylate kinase [Klebsiella pneumoniae]|uniref:Thymidylate kinase n=1 Tax=Klebsiella pneumoniae TaxID=573 RepID=A0A2X3EKB2_KLEPN|nr:thymidylate kinase [Klebsiella pneumoniae]